MSGNVGRYRVLAIESRASIEERRRQTRERMLSLGIGRHARGRHENECAVCAARAQLPAVKRLLDRIGQGGL
jgi:hypothetical protein